MTATEKKRAAMLIQFAAFRQEIDNALGGVADTLARGEYAYACRQLSAISQHHARTSVDMRSIMVRHGWIANTDD